jgi:hypothetical protein
MPWLKSPHGGNGSDDGDAFFMRKVVRRPAKPDTVSRLEKKGLRSNDRSQKRAGKNGKNGKNERGHGGKGRNGRKPPMTEYVFDARAARRGDFYQIYVLRWTRPTDETIPLDGVHTNLLNDTIIWIARDEAPRTRKDAKAWFNKWAECLVDYFETRATFCFPRDPDL